MSSHLYFLLTSFKKVKSLLFKIYSWQQIKNEQNENNLKKNKHFCNQFPQHPNIFGIRIVTNVGENVESLFLKWKNNDE